MSQLDRNQKFYNIADKYIAFHANTESDIQFILDDLGAVPVEKRDEAWKKDVDSITDIFMAEKNFTTKVNDLVLRKMGEHDTHQQ